MALAMKRWLLVTAVTTVTACPDDPGPGAGDTADDTGTDDGNTSLVDETGDDSPPAATIPEIKEGMFESSTRVQLQGVAMTTAEATIDAGRNYFVQDPDQTTLAGLRMVVPPIFEVPSGAQLVDLTGTLYLDQGRGWALSFEGASEGATAEPIAPIPTQLSLIAPDGTERVPLADMVVTLDATDGEMLWISDNSAVGFELNEQITVDVTAFALSLQVLDVGTPIQAITGVVLLDDADTVLIPRSVEEIIL